MAIISDKDFIRYLSQQRKLSKVNDLAQQFLLHPSHIYRLLQVVNQDLRRAGLPPLLVQRSISSSQARFLAAASQNWSLGFSWSAQERRQKNPTYKVRSFFSATDQQLLRDRREYHLLAVLLQDKFPKLTGQQKENIHLLLTLQLLSFSKDIDQKARAATFQDLLQISQAISAGIIPKIGLSKVEQNRINTNKLVQAIQTQLKPFWFVSHFAANNHYSYLLPQPKIEDLLQQLLQQEPLKTKVDQHFPLGFTTNQVRILAMIISHYQYMAKIKPPIKVLFETNLPIYSRQLIIDFINGLPITCQITVRVISPKNQPNDITEDFDLLITEKTKSTTPIPLYHLPEQLSKQNLMTLKNFLIPPD